MQGKRIRKVNRQTASPTEVDPLISSSASSGSALVAGGGGISLSGTSIPTLLQVRDANATSSSLPTSSTLPTGLPSFQGTGTSSTAHPSGAATPIGTTPLADDESLGPGIAGHPDPNDDSVDPYDDPDDLSVPTPPDLSDEFDMLSVDRGVAVQNLILNNFRILTEEANLFQGLFLQETGGVESLYMTEVMSIWQYSTTTAPQILLLPLVVKFRERGGTVISNVLPAKPCTFADNTTLIPLMVCVLHCRPGADLFLIYTGKMGPTISPDSFYGLLPNELGMEFLVPRKYVADLQVFVPEEILTRVLLSQIMKKLPGIELKIPILSPIPSKTLYVHQDNIFVWEKCRATAPTTKAEIDSLFIVRNTHRNIFITLQNSPYVVEVEPTTYVRSLIAMSLLSPDECITEFRLINGLYSTLVRNLRIMSDPDVLSRFILGDWPGTFQLQRLSLYHFLPTFHRGFDYMHETTDIFLALKNFVNFCVWLFGDHWLYNFEPDLMKWQTASPWIAYDPWIIHTCVERALAAWFKECTSHGHHFCYVNHETGRRRLANEFEHYLQPAMLLEVKETYNRQYARVIVYPTGCSIPPQGRTSTQGASAQDTGTSLSRSTSLVTSDEVPRKKPREDTGSSQQKPDAVPTKNRYYYANLASVFKITVNPRYQGNCDDPLGRVCKAGGYHYSDKSPPAISAVTAAMRSFTKLNPSSSDLLVKLEEMDK